MKRMLSIALVLMMVFVLAAPSYAHNSKKVQDGVIDVLSFPFELVACVVSIPARLLKGDRYCKGIACPMKGKKACPMKSDMKPME